MISLFNIFRRYASRAVQNAHARVTRENERYVREAIVSDANLHRVTQERDQANAEIAKLQDALKSLDFIHNRIRAELARERDVLADDKRDLRHQIDELNKRLELRDIENRHLERMRAGHANICPLADAIAEEDATKRRSDV